MTVPNPTGVIQQFLHPPLGLLRREAIPGGPFTGLRTHTRTRGPVGVDAFGFRYNVVQFPSGYGVDELAGQNTFDRTVIWLTIQHRLLDGEDINSGALQLRAASEQVLFNEALPQRVIVEAAPGIAYDAWWLLVL